MMHPICRRELSSKVYIRIQQTSHCKRFSTSTPLLAKKFPKSNSKTVYKPRSPPSSDPNPKPKPIPIPSPSHSAPKSKKARRLQTVGLVGAGLVGTYLVALLAYDGASLYRDWDKQVPTSFSEQADVSARYNTIAPDYDAEVDSGEWWWNLHKRREELVSQARGHVLEVSIGTGRNLEWYDWKFAPREGRKVGLLERIFVAFGGEERVREERGRVKSFTAVDRSGEMLDVAKRKFGELYPGIGGVRWVVGDASVEIPEPAEGEKYDTIVQTMGLCSVGDPVKLLRKLGEFVKEEEGKILLLEHGRAKLGIVNKILDVGAEKRAEDFGCWWNRDLEDIVKASGLEVMDVRRYQFSTVWWIELKKKSRAVKPVEVVAIIKEKVADVSSEVKKNGWW